MTERLKKRKATVDIFSLLFSKDRDFLITNDARQVRVEDLRGKTILVLMLSLTGLRGPNLAETFHLIDTYNELLPKGGFEVVFVLVTGSSLYERHAEERFDCIFSRMPWPAVPFSDKLACDRIGSTFHGYSTWVIISPRGKVLMYRLSCMQHFFNYYGGPDFPLSFRKLDRLDNKEEEILEGRINLNRIFATPCRDFLLANDGTKVPISSLKNKVVGLYFCDNSPSPPRMKAIKKVYQQARDLGYDFEIVQVNFHFPNNCRDLRCREIVQVNFHFPNNYRDLRCYIEDIPLKPQCESTPWLTLPFKDPCCKRLRRIFKCNRGQWLGDRLVIINPCEPNIRGKGTFCSFYGADIIRHFGIEAYPFTPDRAIELEHATMKQELKLQYILGLPLLRHREGGCDQVPVSQLWGKSVLILFAHHSQYDQSCERRSTLPVIKSKFLEQQELLYGGKKFEVVYISKDPDYSTFDGCTKKMPWLVHPYSLEFADLWMSKIFGNIRYYDTAIAAVAFHADGELQARKEDLSGSFQEYPFMEMDLIHKRFYSSDFSENSDTDSDR